MMDLNDLRIAVTVLSFLCFAGIVWWAWDRRNREQFDDCARIPFAGTDTERRP